MDPASQQQQRARGRSKAGRAQGQQEVARRPGQPPGPPTSQPVSQPPPVVQAHSSGGRSAHRGGGSEPRPGGLSAGSVQPAHTLEGSGRSSHRAGTIVGTEGRMGGTSAGGAASGGGDHPVGRGAWRGRGEIILTRPPECLDKKGTDGKCVHMISNYFRILSTLEFSICQYHVDFNPSVDSIGARRRMIYSKEDVVGKVRIFDGMALWTARKISEDPYEFVDALHNGDKVRVTIKFIKELPSNDPQVVQIMCLVMRRIFSNLKFKLIQRHYFDVASTKSIPEHKLKMIPGFETSIRQYDGGLMMCADHTFKIIRTEDVLSVLSNLANNYRRGDWRDEATRQIVGQIVMTEYNNKTYRVDEIDFESSPKSTFPKKDGNEISYIEYYKAQYTFTIKDVNQPMLVSRPKRRDINRGQTMPYYLVPELCKLTGLSEETRSNFNVMRDVAKYTKLDPNQRANELNKFMGRIASDKESMEQLKSWGLKFAQDLHQIQGRELGPEPIFARGKDFNYPVDKPDWTNMFRNYHQHVAVDLVNWALIYSQRDGSAAEAFCINLQRVAPPMGIRVEPPKRNVLKDDRIGSYVNAITSLKTMNVKFVVVIINSKSKDKYDAVKKTCCIDFPIPSQVLVARTLSNPKRVTSVVTKVVVQINCKLGGAPWHVDVPLKDTMIIGYDSYHDSAQKNRSVGALCCSMNKEITKYHSGVSFQISHQEIVDGLTTNLIASLKRYNELNKKLPNRIFIYRDGVGEGQLKMVKDMELPQIKDSFKRLSPEYQPLLTFIIVTKRISTRIMLKTQNLVNPTPGTVVDSEITRPEWYDFFLISQECSQGTASPTQYNVIWDDNKLKPQHVQKLTHKMTHMYFNWSGTVRVPAPCVYAHKLAFLTGQSLHQHHSLELSDTLFFL